VCDAVGVESVRVLGQSLGGAVATLVDRERPGSVERAILAEAVLFPMVESGPGATSRATPMAEGARRRRRVFPSREAVVEAYLGRGGLVGIGRESMDAYARWGFVDRDDGQVELACDPETEASIFEMTPTPTGNAAGWEHLPRMSAATVLVAGRATNIGVARFEAQAEHSGLELIVVDGGHFVVQEDLPRAAAMVRDHLL
jgi:pimeloyl-ACP methyl ester carboxylesterase